MLTKRPKTIINEMENFDVTVKTYQEFSNEIFGKVRETFRKTVV